MNKIFLYNTLSRKKEEFRPIKAKKIGLYTCGPTVYNFAHIGNLRAYLFEDFLKRALVYNGYKVKHVMNITDVGHLTSDADTGEDKMEREAKKQGKSAWDIAKFYEAALKDDFKKLNIIDPNIWCKATDYIKEQINLVKILEKKGFTYQTSDGIYFDTSKIKNYNKLSHQPLSKLEEGARVEINPEKKNPTDFALWKFSPKGVKRQMEWDSPWGVGFPGWHIECSAMSLKLLGNQLDIHCGGIDHISVHHTNEIAQSEAATGRKFFNYWMHGAFLNIEGGKKMAKSADNFLTLENALTKKMIDPLAYRFAMLQAHYRKPVEYSEEIIKNSFEGLKHLRNQVRELGNKKGKVDVEFKEKFLSAVNNDLNMPQALAVAQSIFKSKLKSEDKLATILDFDKVLGLSLENLVEKEESLPKEIMELKKKREKARNEKNWAESDKLRDEIQSMGYTTEDTDKGMRISKI